MNSLDFAQKNFFALFTIKFWIIVHL